MVPRFWDTLYNGSTILGHPEEPMLKKTTQKRIQHSMNSNLK